MSDRVELSGRVRMKAKWPSKADRPCQLCKAGWSEGEPIAYDPTKKVADHWSCWEAEHRPKPAPAEAQPKASATPEGAPSPSASASPTPSTYSSYRKNDYIHVEVEFQSAERRALVHVTHELGNGGNTGLKEYPVQLEDEINRVEEMVVRKARLLFHESGMDKHLL
jgi:hypothetical protein